MICTIASRLAGFRSHLHFSSFNTLRGRVGLPQGRSSIAAMDVMRDDADVGGRHLVRGLRDVSADRGDLELDEPPFAFRIRGEKRVHSPSLIRRDISSADASAPGKARAYLWRVAAYCFEGFNYGRRRGDAGRGLRHSGIFGATGAPLPQSD